MKKLISILVAVALCISMLPASVMAEGNITLEFQGAKMVNNAIQYTVGGTTVTVAYSGGGGQFSTENDHIEYTVASSKINEVSITLAGYDSGTMQVKIRAGENFEQALTVTGDNNTVSLSGLNIPNGATQLMFSVELNGGQQGGGQGDHNGPTRYNVGNIAVEIRNADKGNVFYHLGESGSWTPLTGSVGTSVGTIYFKASPNENCKWDDFKDSNNNNLSNNTIKTSGNTANITDAQFTTLGGDGISIENVSGNELHLSFIDAGPGGNGGGTGGGPDPEPNWYTVSWSGGNVSVENGEVIAERVHVAAHDGQPKKTYTVIQSEYDESDNIFSLWDTIGKKEPDALQIYGLGFSQSDLFIAKNLGGVSIDFKFIPKYGYQLENIYTNEDQENSCLSSFTTTDVISEFTFNVTEVNSNVHFCVYFKKVDDTASTDRAANVSDASISNGSNAASSGNLALTVADTTTDTTIENAVGTLDLTLDNVVSKGGSNGDWTQNITSFDNDITLALTLDTTTYSGTSYKVVREHGGKQDDLSATYNNGILTFSTNKFSKYTIVDTTDYSGSNNTTDSGSSAVTPVVTPTVKAEDGEVSVAPQTTAQNGEAKAEVSEKNVSDAISAAKADEANAIVIAPVVKGDADKVEVALPTTALESVVSGTNAALNVQTDAGAINIPNDTLAEIVKAAGGENISMSVETVAAETIADKLPETVSTEGAVAVNFTITSGDETITSFGGKALEVQVPVDTKQYDEGKTYTAFVVSDDGSVEQTTATISDGSANVTMYHFSTVVITKEETSPFTDVKAGAYYYDAVLWAAANGITDGTSKTTFSPDAVTTRAQVVTYLWRAAGCPEVNGTGFADVAPGSYYEKAVAWAVHSGITDGVGSGMFAPDATCTRGQIVTFLYRFHGADPLNGKDNPFADVKAGEYYADAVLWAKDSGVTDGTSATTFSPSNDCTRAQVVTFLCRLLGK